MKINWVVNGYTYGFKNADPTVSDINYPISYIWINKISSIAYILISKDDDIAVWSIKNPDSIHNVDTDFQINILGTTSLLDIISSRSELPANVVTSDPGLGEYKITSIRMDENKKMVATYEE